MPRVSWECINLLQELQECIGRCDKSKYERFANLAYYLCQPQPELEWPQD